MIINNSPVTPLFGWQFKRKLTDSELPSFTPKQHDDGAYNVTASGFSGAYFDLDGATRSESELITKYREMSLHPEVDAAIDEIVNEAISVEENSPVKLILDDVPIEDNIKEIFEEVFGEVLRILNFRETAYTLFRKWYIDGRLYFQVIIDEENPDAGILEARYIDPRKIKKIREVIKKRPKKGVDGINFDTTITQTKNEYYIFSDRGFLAGNKWVGNQNTTGLKIAKDAIVQITSGMTDAAGVMVLSNLHKAIKPLNQLRCLEDASIIYRLVRAPERRVWYLDVGNLPRMQAEQYMRDQMIKHKNKLVYDANTGEVRDDRKFMCFTLDTKVPLLDGRTLSLQEIINEYKSGKKNWVYSCDPITGKFVPGPITWAGLTKKNSDVVKVTLDNGKSIVCTPDHKFPVWNEGLVEAKNLQGKSLIPGYRRTKSIIKNGAEYEQIYKNDTKTWEFTHREVAKWKNENHLKEDFTFNYKYINNKKSIVHHKDFNRFNNSPDNLLMMNYKDHNFYHHNIQSIEYSDEIFQHVKNCAEKLLSINETIDFINKSINLNIWKTLNENKNPKNRNVKDLIFTHKDLTRVCKLLGVKNWNNLKKQYDCRIKEPNGRVKRGTFIKGSNEWKQKLSLAAQERKPYSKTWKITTPSNETLIIENLNDFCRENDLNRSNIKYKNSKGYHAEILHNHKVVSVEWLDNKEDVGALTIDNKETYHSHHTYLLDIGVYTKNTILEDYWLARRDGRGTEVDTLPPGQNFNEIDDILFFQKRLYSSLNVPINRLDPNNQYNIGLATEISRDEVKFTKFIHRLRNRFSSLFTQLLGKQLALKKIVDIEQYEEISKYFRYEYCTDNYFLELQEAQMEGHRNELAQSMTPIVGKYISNRYVRKKILKQTDLEMEEMDAEMAEEMSNPLYYPELLAPNPAETEDDGGPNGQNGPNDSKKKDNTQSSQEPASGVSKDNNRRHNIIQATHNQGRLKKLARRGPNDEKQLRSVTQFLVKNT